MTDRAVPMLDGCTQIVCAVEVDPDRAAVDETYRAQIAARAHALAWAELERHAKASDVTRHRSSSRIDSGPLVAAVRRKSFVTGKALKQTVPEHLTAVFRRAVSDGTITDRAADRIACEVLHTPLELLYGPDYDVEAA